MPELPPRVDPLVRSLMETIEAGLGVAVALARTAAVAVSGDRPVPPSPDTKPVPAMLFYAATTAKELGTLASRAFASATSTPAPAHTAQPASQPSMPLVRPGGTLRIPLSVENPGDGPMADLAPAVRTILRDGLDVRPLVPAASIRFEPARLTIAPRDFEKLTVFVSVPPGAPPGRYDATLTLGAEGGDLPLSFEVVA